LDAATFYANYTILSIYIKLNAAGSKTIIFSNSGGNAQTITSTTIAEFLFRNIVNH
jgi:hypothetical protein